MMIEKEEDPVHSQICFCFKSSAHFLTQNFPSGSLDAFKVLAFGFYNVHGWPHVTVGVRLTMMKTGPWYPSYSIPQRKAGLAVFHWKTYPSQNEFILAVSYGVSKNLCMHATLPARCPPTSTGDKNPHWGKKAASK